MGSSGNWHGLAALSLTGCVSVAEPIVVGDSIAGQGNGASEATTLDIGNSTTSASETDSTSGTTTANTEADSGTIPQTDTSAAGSMGTLVADDGSSDEGVSPLPCSITAPMGWAFVSGLGVTTTTGGEGGPTVRITTIDELRAALVDAGDEPRIIEIDGAIAGDVTVSQSNKTLIGLPEATLTGALKIEGAGPDAGRVTNIIVKNLRVVGRECSTNCDAVQLQYAHHVWIDHCDIVDGFDGNLDITRQSDFVTISFTRLRYNADSAWPTRRANLIGSEGDIDYGAEQLRVTLHHNWFGDGVMSYMPRVRFGRVHVFNNYYTPTEAIDCIRAGLDSNLRIENNYFGDQVVTPFSVVNPDDMGVALVALGNIFAGVDGPLEPDPNLNPSAVFGAPYTYTLCPTDQVPEFVMTHAGTPP